MPPKVDCCYTISNNLSYSHSASIVSTSAGNPTSQEQAHGGSAQVCENRGGQIDLTSTMVVIPMLNEEDSIGPVLRALPPVQQVIVCDNGSTDNSPEIARSLGATVVLEPQRGYGAACLKGLEYIAAAESTPEIVVFLDGDFSDHPEEITALVHKIQAEDFDFVVGSRIKGQREKGAMLFQALFGNRLACFLMWLFWGARYSDLGPFRAIRYAALLDLKMSDRNFGWTIEMQIKATEQKLKTIEVPVSYRKRIGQSKISGTILGSIKAGYKILYTIFRYRFFPRKRSTK